VIITITIPTLAVIALIYVVMNPEKAEKIAGWGGVGSRK